MVKVFGVYLVWFELCIMFGFLVIIGGLVLEFVFKSEEYYVYFFVFKSVFFVYERYFQVQVFVW